MRFSLASFLAAVALIAVLLGTAIWAPGLAVLLLCILAPTLVRTAMACRRRRTRGAAMTQSETAVLFMGSLGVVLVLGLASAATFAAPCYGAAFLGSARGGLGGALYGMAIGGSAGILAAGWVLFVLGRRLWPIRGKAQSDPTPVSSPLDTMDRTNLDN